MIRSLVSLLAVLALVCTGAAYAWNSLTREYDVFWMPRTEHISVENDGLTLTGEIRPAGASEAPLIVYLHHSSRSARKARLTRTLLGAMSREFPVASFDLRGYGESEGHQQVETAEQLDFVGDLRAWLDLFRDEYGFERERIVLVGHSTGAGAIVHYLAEYPDEPLRAALILPIYPEKVREVLDPGESEIEKRWEKDMRTTENIHPQVVRSLIEQMAFTALPRAQHGREVLIIDTPGAYVEPFPHSIYERLAGPRRLYKANEGDHYLGTRNQIQRRVSELFRGRLGLVHREHMAPVLDEIAALARR